MRYRTNYCTLQVAVAVAAKLASSATPQWRSRSLTDQQQTANRLRDVDNYPSDKAFQNSGIIAMAILYNEIIVEISTLEELGLKRNSFQDHHSKDNA
jgi:isopropylmalate/homocitrate/citramalate synthase